MSRAMRWMEKTSTVKRPICTACGQPIGFMQFGEMGKCIGCTRKTEAEPLALSHEQLEALRGVRQV